MANKKILVIGGSGFIGKNICEYLVNKNEDVFSFDIQKPESGNGRVKYIVGDFFDDECLQSAVEGMDIIIHSLSTVNPGNSNLRYMQGYSRDFIQSIKLFNMAIERKIKVVFLSSGGTVYGVQENQPIKESQLPLPINHYGTVKLCIENVIRTFNTQLHTKMLIARISNPYGPGQDYQKGVGFVDAAMKKAMKKETVEIWGDGSIVRDYIYIEDVCAMVYSLLDYAGSEEVFNISSNEGISQNTIIQELEELGLKPNVIYKDKRSVDVPAIVLDNKKIKEVYNGKITLFKDGMRRYQLYLDTKK